jgi:hypothetical protein
MRLLWIFVVTLLLAPRHTSAHETLTTTVLFDREIVRILSKHCVMCHTEGGPSFPLGTYEQSWLQRRPIRADVISRHMPPWSAVPGYGEFSNDNSLTLRETQFIVSWVEGLGPRNSGTVFSNVAGATPSAKEVRATADFGHWSLGQPSLKRQLAPTIIEPKQTGFTKKIVVDLGLTANRQVRALEFMPSDRRVVRAAFFTVQETGQWIGSWTPWYGFVSLPKGVTYRLPAGAHIVAEVHYQGANERVQEQGSLGLYFSDESAPIAASDLVVASDLILQAPAAGPKTRSSIRLESDVNVLAIRPEVEPGITSVEVSGRKPDGSTIVLLFAKNFQADWPTPYLMKDPVSLPKGTELFVTAYSVKPTAIRVTVSCTQLRAPRTTSR